MSRQKIVAGNWKMNKTLDEANRLVEEILNDPASQNSVTKIFFPPFPFLGTVAQSINTKSRFFVGAQNCNENASGAFTGEVSAAMLASVGCKYVLVGHSERRQYFGEANSVCSRKIAIAIENDLIPVYCIGERLTERKTDRHFDRVETQIKEALAGFEKDKLAKIIIAYEPVWAIGTGETATPQQAQEMHAFIRKILKDLFGDDISSGMSLLYGGSCNAQNAKELFACPDVDGGLIGGASLKAEDFCKIISSF